MPEVPRDPGVRRVPSLLAVLLILPVLCHWNSVVLRCRWLPVERFLLSRKEPVWIHWYKGF